MNILHGMELSVKIANWDFAGQEIYYATHQLFLSERSVFLIVFNLASPMHNYIKFWLESVHKRAPGSPVVLVGTHADDERCSEEYLETIRHEMRIKYQTQFPKIAGFFFVSVTTGKGMDSFCDELAIIIAAHKCMGEHLPRNYLELEKLVLSEAKKRMPPVIPWAEYMEMAKLCLIFTERDLLAATSVLHKFGSLFHFPEYQKLQEVVILDPQWLMDLMSSVISTKHNFCKDGILAASALPQIWKAPKYPPEMHPFILSLIERFEISFPIDKHAHNLALRQQVDGEEMLYLIPIALPEKRPVQAEMQWPAEIGPEESLFGRAYQMPFLPNGFFGRLMVRLLAFPLKANLYWRTGLIAQMGKEMILVELTQQTVSHVLNVLVRTKLRGEDLSSLSWLVFAAVETLTQDWYNMSVTSYVPCSHCLSLGLPNPSLFLLEDCKHAATVPNSSFFYCNNGEDRRPVRLDKLAPDLAMVNLGGHKLKIQDLQKEETPIGEGGFAIVYKGTWRGQPVAIKELKRAALPSFNDGDDMASQRKAFEEFRHEVWIMSGLAHPNLVEMKGFCLRPPCIVTELVESGSLFDFISKESNELTWSLRLKIAKDIAKGCAFLHNACPPVMHRDLKSPNILLASVDANASVVAKVCDFGVSLNSAQHTGRIVDCPLWLAPEVLQNKPYTEKADVYSVGVIYWELLTRQKYFGHIPFMSLIEDKIIGGERPVIPDDCPASYRDLIEACWAQDPGRRPSSNEVIERIEALIVELCPEIVGYDAGVEARFHAERERYRKEKESEEEEQQNRIENQERRQKRLLTMHNSSQLKPVSKRCLLSQSIKKHMLLDTTNPFTEEEINGWMEVFVRQQRVESESATQTAPGLFAKPTSEDQEAEEDINQTDKALFPNEPADPQSWRHTKATTKEQKHFLNLAKTSLQARAEE